MRANGPAPSLTASSSRVSPARATTGRSHQPGSFGDGERTLSVGTGFETHDEAGDRLGRQGGLLALDVVDDGRKDADDRADLQPTRVLRDGQPVTTAANDAPRLRPATC